MSMRGGGPWRSGRKATARPILRSMVRGGGTSPVPAAAAAAASALPADDHGMVLVIEVVVVSVLSPDRIAESVAAMEGFGKPAYGKKV